MSEYSARYIYSGDTLDYTPGADVAAGDVVVFGAGFVGVSPIDIPKGRVGAVSTRGVYSFAKGNEAVAAGDPMYWDASGKKAVKTAGQLVFLGVAVADAADAAGTVSVAINFGRVTA